MTQEDMQLLLTDLCARLTYGVKGLALGGKIDSIKTLSPTEYPWVKTSSGLSCHLGNGQFKPYLRPMSSMTDEEREELRQEQIKDEQLFVDCIKNHPEMRGLIIPHFAADWCDKNMFDYRGLIEKGLAIEAPEGMYLN